LAEIQAVAHNSQCDSDESEHGGARLQMTAEGFVRCGHRHVRVNPSIQDVAVHTDHVRWFRGILDEHVFRWEIPVTHLMDMVAAYRPDSRKNNGVTNLLLLHHLFHSGEQIGVELESNYQHPLEPALDGINVGYL